MQRRSTGGDMCEGSDEEIDEIAFAGRTLQSSDTLVAFKT